MSPLKPLLGLSASILLSAHALANCIPPTVKSVSDARGAAPLGVADMEAVFRARYECNASCVEHLVQNILAAKNDYNAIVPKPELHEPALTEATKADAWLRKVALEQVSAAEAEKNVLRGIPIVVKENIDVKGLSTTAATPGLSYTADKSAEAVRRLVAAGAIVVAKTNMHELALGASSWNTGDDKPIKNARDPSLIAGGSSGGTAVAVATRLVPAGVGGDTMGSIRIPAALNLVVGHRPTPGTYPAGNAAVPVSVTRDSIGVMARSMRDIAILDIVMRKSSAVTLSDIKSNQACASADIHTLRLGYPADWDKKVDDDVRGDFKAILKVLDAKLSIKMVAIPLADLPATFSNALLKTYHDWSGVFTACELEPTLKAYLANKEGTSYAKVVAKLHGDDVKATFGYASYLATNGAEICKTSRVVRDHLIAYYASKLRTSAKPGDVDALIFPTVPIKAPKITDIKAGNFETVKLNAKLCAALNGVPTPPPKPDANGKIDCRLGSVLSYFTDLPSLAGLPGLTLPSRHIGVGIDVNPDNQHQLLPIGFVLERLLPAPAP